MSRERTGLSQSKQQRGQAETSELLRGIEEAAARLKRVASVTPLQVSRRLSQRHGATVYIKREDLQEVRSFKIRGAYNKISSLSEPEKARGVVCASAGNHAQGVAYSCSELRIRGRIFMPAASPMQKIERVKHFGGSFVEVGLAGDTYDEAHQASRAYCEAHGAVFVHPFNDPLTIAGQGTVGREIHEELEGDVDVVLTAVGGGGLASGVSGYLKQKDPAISVIGVEPAGSPTMRESLRNDRVVTLAEIDTFVDGAAVKTVGDLTFGLCQRYLDRVVVVPEGKVCSTIIELYQNEGIIAEPAGALAVSALDEVAAEIAGRTVVCVLSGGNNDILRYPEIMERSLVYQGRKHYFLIEFAQKPGQLRQFVDSALGSTDDIVLFEY